VGDIEEAHPVAPPRARSTARSQPA
jgi:hypothetical protein